MITKAVLRLALVLATASGTLAASKHDAAPIHAAVNHPQGNGADVGTDPDPNIRFELNRDWDHGRY